MYQNSLNVLVAETYKLNF